MRGVLGQVSTPSSGAAQNSSLGLNDIKGAESSRCVGQPNSMSKCRVFGLGAVSQVTLERLANVPCYCHLSALSDFRVCVCVRARRLLEVTNCNLANSCPHHAHQTQAPLRIAACTLGLSSATLASVTWQCCAVNRQAGEWLGRSAILGKQRSSTKPTVRVTERGRVMQRQSAHKHQQEITLSSNQLCTRTRQPRLHIVPRHLRQHLLRALDLATPLPQARARADGARPGQLARAAGL